MERKEAFSKRKGRRKEGKGKEEERREMSLKRKWKRRGKQGSIFQEEGRGKGGRRGQEKRRSSVARCSHIKDSAFLCFP